MYLETKAYLGVWPIRWAADQRTRLSSWSSVTPRSRGDGHKSWIFILMNATTVKEAYFTFLDNRKHGCNLCSMFNVHAYKKFILRFGKKWNLRRASTLFIMFILCDFEICFKSVEYVKYLQSKLSVELLGNLLHSLSYSWLSARSVTLNFGGEFYY